MKLKEAIIKARKKYGFPAYGFKSWKNQGDDSQMDEPGICRHDLHGY